MLFRSVREQETWENGPIDWTKVDASGQIAPTLFAVQRAVGE